MKDRKPFKLTRPIQLYNIFQVFANAYLVYEVMFADYIFLLACIFLCFSHREYRVDGLLSTALSANQWIIVHPNRL